MTTTSSLPQSGWPGGGRVVDDMLAALSGPIADRATYGFEAPPREELSMLAQAGVTAHDMEDAVEAFYRTRSNVSGSWGYVRAIAWTLAVKREIRRHLYGSRA